MYPPSLATVLATLLSFTSLCILLPTLVLAQDASSPVCKQCIISSRTAAFPDCSGLDAFYPPSRTTGMSEQERNCYCSAARSETWLQKCNNPVEACNNMTINEAKSTYNAVKFFCDAAGIRPPTPGQSGTPPDKGTTPGQGNNSPDQDIPSLAMSLSMGMSTFVGLITAAAVASLGVFL